LALGAADFCIAALAAAISDDVGSGCSPVLFATTSETLMPP